MCSKVGRESAVGIATRYGLDRPVSDPSGGSRFSAPVQTGSGAYSASYTMGTGSFPGIKRPGRSVDHQLPSNTEVKKRVELYLYSTHGPSWTVIGWTLLLPFYLHFEDHYFAHYPSTCPTSQIARFRSGERGGPQSPAYYFVTRNTV